MPTTNMLKVTATGKQMTLAEVKAFVAAAEAQRLSDDTPITGQHGLSFKLKWLAAEGQPRT